jgi:uncharacterized surface protein with fasciclin (FAS1) repeats
MNTRLNHARVAAVAAVGVALTLTLSACGGSDSTSAAGSTRSAGSATETTAPESPTTPAMTEEPFGPGCASVPADGAGSFAGMAKDPVATAASNNPALSTLVSAVKQAGLVDTLNGAQDITVFAPTDDAFAALDKATLDKAMSDKELLTKILTTHVVQGRKAPDQLAGTLQTLNGEEVTVKGSGTDFTVGVGAKVVCGNVQTANATVYIIDQVLMP